MKNNTYWSRVAAATTVWFVGLLIWLLMAWMFSNDGGLSQARHVVATIAGLADPTLCVAQLIGICVLVAIAALVGGVYSQSQVQGTQNLYMAETLTICINFSIVFGLTAVLGLVTMWVGGSGMKQTHVLANGAMALLNGGVGYLVSLKVK